MRDTYARSRLSAAASCLLGAAVAASGTAIAQDDAGDPDAANRPAMDEIVVTGSLRESLESSMQVKRAQTVVSDAIIGAELGDLPDLSVAETLERITGVTSDRFKGGASELSIRGLGAFLGASFINGREISSGSDGRDVNYGQFPSELISGAIVYKSQQASFVEGGISGNIELQTLRPLDYGQRRTQLQALAGYSEYEERVDDGSPVTGRVTGSFVDQFETGIGDIGISIGGQIRRGTAPEDIYTSSSTYRPCNTIEGLDGSNNCEYLVDASGAPVGESPTYFVSNQYIFRAMQTEADRDAVMSTVQWRPNEEWEFNFDAQYSDRSDLELRHNLVVADGRRDITPIDISPTGALTAWSGETRIENQSVWRVRDEEYVGLGLNSAWSNDRLSIAADVSYSQTERRQDELDMRIRTNDRVLFDFDTRGQTIPSITITDVSEVEEDTGLTFNLDNHDLYDNGARARRRLENIDDDIFAVRFDGELFFDDGLFTSLRSGVRFADRNRVHDDGIDTELPILGAGYQNPDAIAARRDSFAVDDLFEGADTPMEGVTWATWEPEALWMALTGDRNAGLPTGSTLSPHDADIAETSYALYLQGNFATELLSLPATGNIGIRAVYTEVESVGVSTALATAPGPDPDTIVVTPVGDPTINVEKNDFWNILPSANIAFELSDTKLLRFAAYSAMARPDQEAMSAALAFDDEAELGNLGAIVSASGNPFLEPIESINFDASFEWYATDVTAFSVAFYAKRLQAGYSAIQEEVTLIVNGEPTSVIIGRRDNSDDKSRLIGAEVSVQHVFENLPSPFNGLGVRAGYNYADSDFEFPDPTVPDGVNALADFTEPANIPGYSEHSGNIAAFWENERTSLRLAYKFRTDYFKPFRNDANRYTDSQQFLDFSASFDLTDYLEFRVQGLNLLDEPNVFFRPTRDSLAQADYAGRRFFAGIRLRLQ